MSRPKAPIARGIAGGILGGAALAAWFLIVDASTGQPFHTPAFMASALLGRETVEITFGLIILYTAIHFAAFIVLGALVAWILSFLRAAPSMLLGFVLGFALFDVVFYLSVVVTGVDVAQELGWPEVLAGNLVAGVTLMGFLHLTGATKPVIWWETLAQHRVIREGILAGLIGAATVAAWFFLFDLIRRQPFFTPAALGSALFLGASDLSSVTVNAVTVTGYTLVHVAAFVATGTVAVLVACQAEERPPLILGGVLLFVAFEAFFMGLLAMVAEFILGTLAWWTIAVGNLLATVTIGYYLWRMHPKLRKALAEDPLDRSD